MGGVNLASCPPYRGVGVLLLHLADGAFNESECSGRRPENNPEELQGAAGPPGRRADGAGGPSESPYTTSYTVAFLSPEPVTMYLSSGETSQLSTDDDSLDWERAREREREREGGREMDGDRWRGNKDKDPATRLSDSSPERRSAEGGGEESKEGNEGNMESYRSRAAP
ncbi:hypothetical protein EYF80_030119 [Liparis tanakae]|uniref:Uncharacterized protein n=1 Tax=Liparis tanakae TaxID=230148 RepID=A0A4Z2H3G4_9TELE|nr:hypothetical protein EYF80_030119 [Liparis tanakae]